MKHIRNIVITTIAWILSQNLSGQNNFNPVVDVLGEYSPTISDAVKINQNPRISDTLVLAPRLNYYINSKLVKTQFIPEPIKPAVMKGEPLTKLYKHLIKMGFGNYTTPYIEYFFNSTRSRDWAYGIHYRHISSAGKIKNYAYPGTSDNNIELSAKKFMKNHILTSFFDYNRNVVHRYGFFPSDFTPEPKKKEYRQRFNDLNAGLNFESAFNKDNKINHSLGLNWYMFADKYKTNENNLSLNADINKNISWLKISGKQNIGLTLQGNIWTDKMDTSKTTTTGIVSFKPYLSTRLADFNIKFGVDASIQADTVAEMFFYPMVELDLTLLEKVLLLHASITGNLEKNNFKALGTENPFISSALPLPYTNNKLNLNMGIRSSFSRNVDFAASLTACEIENMPFFVTDTFAQFRNTFSIVTDDVRTLNPSVSLSFHKSEKLLIIAKGNYFQYNTDKEIKAWHKPEWNAGISMFYNLQNKFIIKSEISANGKSFQRGFDKDTNGLMVITPKEIKPWVDASLGIEYRYTKILSAFINFNNLTAARYYRWYNYPSYKFNILAGISYSL